MFDTTDESSDDKCFGDCGGGDHPPLENEFHEDESSDVLDISAISYTHLTLPTKA